MRFVVLHHTGWPGHADHYDLMLQMEAGADDNAPVLKTFASLEDRFPDGRSHADARARGGQAGGPDARSNLLRLIAYHRSAYLRFEGDLSGGRGQVARVEEGGLEFLAPPDEALGELRFRLAGGKLRGDYRLRHMGGGLYAFERQKRL